MRLPISECPESPERLQYKERPDHSGQWQARSHTCTFPFRPRVHLSIIPSNLTDRRVSEQSSCPSSCPHQPPWLDVASTRLQGACLQICKSANPSWVRNLLYPRLTSPSAVYRRRLAQSLVRCIQPPVHCPNTNQIITARCHYTATAVQHCMLPPFRTHPLACPKWPLSARRTRCSTSTPRVRI